MTWSGRLAPVETVNGPCTSVNVVLRLKIGSVTCMGLRNVGEWFGSWKRAQLSVGKYTLI